MGLARKRFEKNGVVNRDIGDDEVGHVQARSILGPVYDHIKILKEKTNEKSDTRV